MVVILNSWLSRAGVILMVIIKKSIRILVIFNVFFFFFDIISTNYFKTMVKAYMEIST